MRIIGGNFRGKKILEPKDKETRPLKDLTKESIFNIVKHSNKFLVELNDSEVLDLFCGTGSFGLECLSRGAKYVTFIENYAGILPILKKNLNNLKNLENYKIIEKDILNNLNYRNFEKKFDIIFLDPPYKQNNLSLLIDSMLDNKILKTNGIIIIHRHKRQNDKFTEKFKILEKKKYGISKIIFGSYA